MRTRAVILAVLLLTTVAGLHGAVGTAGSVDEGPRIQIGIDVAESGDAVWTVTARYELTSTNETEAFDALVAEFEANETTDGPQLTPFRELVERADSATDRDMEITSVERAGDIQNRSAAAGNGSATGTLTLQFQWTNFARSENDTLSLGDAFGDAWQLGAGQVLVIRPPEGYSVDTVRPSTSVENGVIRWEGPQSFASDEPAVRYVPAGSSPNEPDERGLTGYVVWVVIALIGGGLAVYAWVRRDRLFEERGAAVPEESGEDGAADVAAGTGASSRADEEPPSGTEATDSETDSAGGEEPIVDPELLSDEERIEHLLEQNGGRMKQAAIVEETGWSNAKVSQLLSAMADEGRVEKLRIGRENLISLPEEE